MKLVLRVLLASALLIGWPAYAQTTGPGPYGEYMGSIPIYPPQYPNQVFGSPCGATGGSPVMRSGCAQDSFSYTWRGGSGLPTVVSGTTPVVAAGSNNAGGNVTSGTGSPSTIAVTFGTSYPTNAWCVIWPANAAAAAANVVATTVATTPYTSSQSKTGFTITMPIATNSASWNYSCEGY